MTANKLKDKIGKGVFASAAVVCTISVVAIFAFLIAKSVPALKEIGFFDFLFGDKWMPDKDDVYGSAAAGSYGIFTMIVGTLSATVGALLIGGTLGYFTAIFLAFYCPKFLKNRFRRSSIFWLAYRRLYTVFSESYFCFRFFQTLRPTTAADFWQRRLYSA